MSETTVGPVPPAPAGDVPARPRLAVIRRNPVALVIAATTVLALGLRIYQLMQDPRGDVLYRRSG